ncbi:uncharacterized protein LOC134696925 [Mytilus trossulus]|uniref:uncharacterized protein LOC134696925 n=1 Tax=Mytilus trossulus TaxID=6551 RepID=UPI003005E6D1
MPFRPHTDPEDKKHITNAKMYCRDRFGKHVGRGEPMECDNLTNTKTYNPLKETQSKIQLPIYSSRSEDPQYTDEEDCTYIGKFEVDLSDVTGPDREVEIVMKFGGADITVEATVKSTGQTIDARYVLRV